VVDTPGVDEHLGGGRAVVVARFPAHHPVRAGDRVELAVDTRQLSYFDPLTGEALWHPG
jgi:hypothetical protein